jgi:hypothetical protein
MNLSISSSRAFWRILLCVEPEIFDNILNVIYDYTIFHNNLHNRNMADNKFESPNDNKVVGDRLYEDTPG